jgi:hypothetical protein
LDFNPVGYGDIEAYVPFECKLCVYRNSAEAVHYRGFLKAYILEKC